MKVSHIFCIAGALCFGIAAHAQDAQSAVAAAAAELSKAPEVKQEEPKPQYWKSSAKFDFGLDQTGLWDWAAGGYNTLTLVTGLDAKADYAKDLTTWANHLQLDYGFLWSADKSNLIQKSTDRIYLESKWGYKTGKDSKWSYSASYNFRSQFSQGYSNYKQAEDGSWSGTLKSAYLAPAYTDIALGIDWVPNQWLTVNVAPITGGYTIVRVEELRKSYGMQLRDEDISDPTGKDYRGAKFQFGAQLKADAKFVINDVFNYQTQLVLFTDYLDSPFHKVRVNWDNKIVWDVAKYIKLKFNTWLIYDPNVLIVNNDDIAKYPDGTQRIQFKEFTSLTFSYTLTPRSQR